MNSILLFCRKFCLNIAQNSGPVMKYLNVAEKNDAAKTISGILSNGTSIRREGLSVYNKIYEFDGQVAGRDAKMIMTSVSGHLLSQDFGPILKNWMTCDPITLFEAPIVKYCPENFVKIKQTLEKEIRHCAGLIIWTDCDREGENIGAEIIEVCKRVKPNITVYRAKFSEMTPASLRRALANLGRLDERQSQAVEVRTELDLRIGAALTRFQTMRLRGSFPDKLEQGSLVSYGSCQIPTLGFVVQRYMEATNFIPQQFWKVKVNHKVNEVSVEFNWARNRLFDKQCCEAFVQLCQASPQALVNSVVEKPKSKWRPTALDTVELEKLASRKLYLTAKETMTIAEKLYNKGFISYPRTETNIFSKEVNLRSLVEHHTQDPGWGRFANKVLSWGPNPRNGKKSDQAHPPIHPIKHTDSLSGNDKKVYELIVRHFLACVSKDAVGSETIVNITIAGEDFTATGLVIKERNYLEVYPYDRWNAKEILNYERGTHFEPTEIALNEGSTTAPALLTEADLISLMEKHGIGTDATHAEHITKIKERGYIGVTDRGFLIPGVLGMGLVEGYEAMNLALAQPELRAELEVDLKRICEGTKNPELVLREQIQKYKEIYKIIAEKVLCLDTSVGHRYNTTPQSRPANQGPGAGSSQKVLTCPSCNTCEMYLKRKKDGVGYYISCLGYPECKSAIWLPSQIKEVTVSDDDCPRCQRVKMLNLKFAQASTMALLNCNGSTYSTCIICDANLREIFDIRLPTANSNNGNSSSWSSNNSNSNRQNSNPPNRPVARVRPLDGFIMPNPTSNGTSNSNRGSNWDSNRGNGNNDNQRRPPTNKKRRNDSPPPPAEAVLCTQCNEPGKKLTVRKEGPNQGKQFYVCSKPINPCKFFKWAEESANENHSHNGTSGRNDGSSRGGAGDSSHNSERSTTRRKCGVCRQEGHTRARCPNNPDAN